MKRLLQILVLSLTLTAYAQPKVYMYNSIIDRVTQIEIDFKDSDKTIELDKNQAEVFKDILKRNIEPEIQRKFIADMQIDLYENDSRMGFLMVAEDETMPFVNFGSDSLNFGI